MAMPREDKKNWPRSRKTIASTTVNTTMVRESEKLVVVVVVSRSFFLSLTHLHLWRYLLFVFALSMNVSLCWSSRPMGDKRRHVFLTFRRFVALVMYLYLVCRLLLRRIRGKNITIVVVNSACVDFESEIAKEKKNKSNNVIWRFDSVLAWTLEKTRRALLTMELGEMQMLISSTIEQMKPDQLVSFVHWLEDKLGKYRISNLRESLALISVTVIERSGLCKASFFSQGSLGILSRTRMKYFLHHEKYQLSGDLLRMVQYRRKTVPSTDKWISKLRSCLISSQGISSRIGTSRLRIWREVVTLTLTPRSFS